MTLSDYRRFHPLAPTRNSTAPEVTHVDIGEVTTSLRRAAAAEDGGASAALREAAGAYIARLEQELRDRLERVPGLDDGLLAEVEFHITASGRLAGARLLKRSADPRFDAAVIEAIASTSLPPRPAGVDEIQQLPVVTHQRR